MTKIVELTFNRNEMSRHSANGWTPMLTGREQTFMVPTFRVNDRGMALSRRCSDIPVYSPSLDLLKEQIDRLVDWARNEAHGPEDDLHIYVCRPLTDLSEIGLLARWGEQLHKTSENEEYR
jgi:hypothetical protein